MRPPPRRTRASPLRRDRAACSTTRTRTRGRSPFARRAGRPPCLPEGAPSPDRSEEHTSELQSRLHLVCRLLLEKKKMIRALGYVPPESEPPISSTRWIGYEH